MLHRDALIVDYGPRFDGTVVRTDEGIVCVVPSRILDSPEVQASMQEMVRDLGGDCGRCDNCPLGGGG